MESLRPGIARRFAAAEARTDAVPSVSDEQPLGIRALGAAGRPAPVRHTQATVACVLHAAGHRLSNPVLSCTMPLYLPKTLLICSRQCSG